LFSIGFQSFGKLAIAVSFQLNKEYIAATLCENRARPGMNCKGKCHLAKEMKQEKERESKTHNQITEKYEVLWHNEITVFRINDAAECKQKFSSAYTVPVFERRLTAVFHPPCA